MDNRHQPAFPSGSQSIPHDQKGLTKLEYAALLLFVHPHVASDEAFVQANQFFDDAEKNKAPEVAYIPAGFELIPGTDHTYRRKE